MDGWMCRCLAAGACRCGIKSDPLSDITFHIHILATVSLATGNPKPAARSCPFQSLKLLRNSAVKSRTGAQWNLPDDDWAVGFSNPSARNGRPRSGRETCLLLEADRLVWILPFDSKANVPIY